MNIQYFIFNYSHYYEALNLYNEFSQYGDTYLLNCASPHDPPFEETEKIKKLPNVYYSGQWNKALDLLNADVMFITNADVKIRSIGRLVKKMTNFYEKYGDKAGLYAPNHFWTPWTYNVSLLEDIGSGLKKVPATDSTIWSVKTDIAKRLGKIDLNINKLGWGIEIVCAWYCSLLNKLVVRDYSIKCDHPNNTSYDRHAADNEWRTMIIKMGLGNQFWEYYNNRNKYGFGWNGPEETPEFEKMLL